MGEWQYEDAALCGFLGTGRLRYRRTQFPGTVAPQNLAVYAAGGRNMRRRKPRGSTLIRRFSRVYFCRLRM